MFILMNPSIKKHNKYNTTKILKKHLLLKGQYGFMSRGYHRISKDKILTLNFILLRKLKLITQKKNYKFWCFLTPNQNLTKLSSESRMGRGKGNIYTQSIFIKPGLILFEFDNVDQDHIHYLYDYFKKKISVNLYLTHN